MRDETYETVSDIIADRDALKRKVARLRRELRIALRTMRFAKVHTYQPDNSQAMHADALMCDGIHRITATLARKARHER